MSKELAAFRSNRFSDLDKLRFTQPNRMMLYLSGIVFLKSSLKPVISKSLKRLLQTSFIGLKRYLRFTTK